VSTTRGELSGDFGVPYVVNEECQVEHVGDVLLQPPDAGPCRRLGEGSTH